MLKVKSGGCEFFTTCCHSERHKKYVLYVWRVLYNSVTFWRKMHRINPAPKISPHTENQKQQSEDKGISSRPEKLRFEQRPRIHNR